MKNINIRKLYYRIRHDYLTTNNLVVIVALLIAASWAWGSVSVIDRNYKLQREIGNKNRQLELVQLETETLKYQQTYYKSDEYKELALRQGLGLAKPGEKALVLPPNSSEASALDKTQGTQPPTLQQWFDFFGGHGGQDLQD